MKNKELNKKDMTEDTKKELKRLRNRFKRYRQKRLSLKKLVTD